MIIIRYIKFKENEFWVTGNDIQFVLAYLYCQLKDDEFFKEKIDLLKDIYESSISTFPPIIHLKIDQSLNENEIIQFAKKLVSIVFNLSKTKNKEISLPQLCYGLEYTEIQTLPKSISKSELMKYLIEIGYLLKDYI